MNAYADSLIPIEDFRKGENSDELNNLELKIYRKYLIAVLVVVQSRGKCLRLDKRDFCPKRNDAVAIAATPHLRPTM